jgi:hypothetical protein
MRRTDLEITDRLPGMSQQATTRLAEWVCPECEYFEEVDGDDD